MCNCCQLIMNFLKSCHSWVSFSCSSASMGSDAHSQASCTTEYEGDMDHVPFDYIKPSFERSITPSEQEERNEISGFPSDMELRDPRLPTPAKVRWLKAYHKVKQIIRRVCVLHSTFLNVSLPIILSVFHQIMYLVYRHTKYLQVVTFANFNTAGG